MQHPGHSTVAKSMIAKRTRAVSHAHGWTKARRIHKQLQKASLLDLLPVAQQSHVNIPQADTLLTYPRKSPRNVTQQNRAACHDTSPTGQRLASATRQQQLLPTAGCH